MQVVPSGGHVGNQFTKRHLAGNIGTNAFQNMLSLMHFAFCFPPQKTRKALRQKYATRMICNFVAKVGVFNMQNIARGTMDPGYWLRISSYLYSWNDYKV